MSCRSVIVGPCKGFGSVKFTGNASSMMYERSAALIVSKLTAAYMPIEKPKTSVSMLKDAPAVLYRHVMITYH